MIPLNELRQGVWVLENGTPFKVDLHNSDFWHSDNFEPIPLTPDILEKCGLIKLNNSWIVDDGSRDEHGSIICGTYTFSILGYNCSELYYGMFHVKHLHDLQNIYYYHSNKTELNCTP